MVKHNVPFFSQKTDIDKEYWQLRGCGITALKMVMHHWNTRGAIHASHSIADLISHGQSINAYIPNIGWSHPGIVNVAKKFGYDGQNYDPVLSQTEIHIAFEQMLTELKKYPILASVFPNFDPTIKDGHIIVVTGFDGTNVHINNPVEKTPTLGVKGLDLTSFLNGWKKRYIVIYPRK